MTALVIDPEPVGGTRVRDGTRRQRTLDAPCKGEETRKRAHYTVVAPLVIDPEPVGGTHVLD